MNKPNNRQAEVLQQHLLEHMNTAVVMVDDRLRINYINPAAEMLLAISRSTVLGTPLVHYFRESDTESTKKALLDALQEGFQFTRRRTRWQLSNGHSLTVDYSVSPLPHGSGLVIEITALDRLLRISREEALISSQETTRHLVRSMAHEIKNPLGGIRGAAQLLEHELADPSLQEFTQVIIEESDRLRNLVDRMLGPNQLPQWQSVNVHEVLEHISSLVTAECGDQIRINKDYDPSIPELPADRDFLVQAILNIVRNAMQSLQESEESIDGCITLRTRIQRQFTIASIHHPLLCRIDIRDNGPGIPQQLIDDIFYPMITGRAQGTGLGLAISQNLIQQHKGLIECESQPGQTTFSIYIPLEQPDATH